MWIPGKDMIFSDHLSHNVNTDTGKSKEPTCKGLDLKVHDVFLECKWWEMCLTSKWNIKGSSADSIKAHDYKRMAKQRNECPDNLKSFVELSWWIVYLGWACTKGYKA